MYCCENFPTKRAMKEAVKIGPTYPVRIYQPGPFGGGEVQDGQYSVEGPHYPASHSWYARVTVKGGIVVKAS